MKKDNDEDKVENKGEGDDTFRVGTEQVQVSGIESSVKVDEDKKEDYIPMKEGKDDLFLTDILDKLINARIYKTPFYKHRHANLYRVSTKDHGYVLKTVEIDEISGKNKWKIEQIRRSFKLMKGLANELQFFSKHYFIKELPYENDMIRIEILTEYDGKYLDKLMESATNVDITKWIIQSLIAIRYCHAKRIAIFDIQPSIFVYKDGILKIADLLCAIEFARKSNVKENLGDRKKELRGFSSHYAPPEAMMGKPDYSKLKGEKFDVYSWGMTFYQLITRMDNKKLIEEREKMLTSEKEYSKFMESLKANDKLIKVDKGKVIFKIIEDCLAFNPDKRPTFADIEKKLKDFENEIYNTEEGAEMFQDIGSAFRELAVDYPTALMYQDKACNFRVLLGEENADVALSYDALGMVYKDMSNVAKANEMFEKAHSIRLKLFGKESPEALTSYYNLAGISRDSGQFEKAKSYCEKVLALTMMLKKEGSEEAAKEGSEEAAKAYVHMSGILRELCKFNEARENLKFAFDIYTKLKGEESLEVARMHHNEGNIYRSQSNKKEALKCYEKALKLFIKIFGEEHVEVANVYNNRGSLYHDYSEHKAAQTNFEKALKIYLSAVGEDHYYTASVYSNLASLLNDMTNRKEALDYAQKALESRTRIFDSEHSEIAKSYCLLGNIHGDMGNIKGAIEYHQKALGLRRRKLEEDHPDIAESYNSLGVHYGMMKDLDNALKYLSMAKEIRLRVFGPNHAETAKSYNNLGNTYNVRLQAKDALACHQEALKIRTVIFGPEHIITATTFTNLGNVYKRTGNKKKAQEYYEKTLNIRKKNLCENHPDTAAAYNNIGAVCEDLEDFTRALENYEKAYEIRKITSGEDHERTKFVKSNMERIKKLLENK